MNFSKNKLFEKKHKKDVFFGAKTVFLVIA